MSRTLLIISKINLINENRKKINFKQKCTKDQFQFFFQDLEAQKNESCHLSFEQKKLRRVFTISMFLHQVGLIKNKNIPVTDRVITNVLDQQSCISIRSRNSRNTNTNKIKVSRGPTINITVILKWSSRNDLY